MAPFIAVLPMKITTHELHNALIDDTVVSLRTRRGRTGGRPALPAADWQLGEEISAAAMDSGKRSPGLSNLPRANTSPRVVRRDGTD
jgi:hypothetical protein